MNDRGHQRAVLRGLRAQEREKEEGEMPLPKEALRELFDVLDGALATPCDHSMRFTMEFIRTRHLSPETILPWLNSYGGYCDCEVLTNVESHWGDRL